MQEKYCKMIITISFVLSDFIFSWKKEGRKKGEKKVRKRGNPVLHHLLWLFGGKTLLVYLDQGLIFFSSNEQIKLSYK